MFKFNKKALACILLTAPLVLASSDDDQSRPPRKRRMAIVDFGVQPSEDDSPAGEPGAGATSDDFPDAPVTGVPLNGPVKGMDLKAFPRKLERHAKAQDEEKTEHIEKVNEITVTNQNDEKVEEIALSKPHIEKAVWKNLSLKVDQKIDWDNTVRRILKLLSECYNNNDEDEFGFEFDETENAYHLPLQSCHGYATTATSYFKCSVILRPTKNGGWKFTYSEGEGNEKLIIVGEKRKSRIAWKLAEHLVDEERIFPAGKYNLVVKSDFLKFKNVTELLSGIKKGNLKDSNGKRIKDFMKFQANFIDGNYLDKPYVACWSYQIQGNRYFKIYEILKGDELNFPALVMLVYDDGKEERRLLEAKLDTYFGEFSGHPMISWKNGFVDGVKKLNCYKPFPDGFVAEKLEWKVFEDYVEPVVEPRDEDHELL